MADNITVEQVMEDFQRAYVGQKDWIEAAKKDYEVRMGKQWDPEDKEKLEKDGRPALTINRIHPMINLLYGIESQNRTDPRAFPEGLEDDLKGEIATRLLKHMGKRDWVAYKVSEQFEHGTTAGLSVLEPWIDYTNDLLYGEFRVKRLDYNQCFPDPSAREYDLSDGEYFVKVTYGLTEEQLTSLYPKAEAQIKEIMDGSRGLIHFENLAAVGKSADSPTSNYDSGKYFWGGTEEGRRKPTGDLLEYYYKKYVPVYYVIDLKLGRVQKTDSKEEAERYKAAFGRGLSKKQREGKTPRGEEWVRIEKRLVPEIWQCPVLGGEILSDKRAWFYPRWNTWHFIPYFCYRFDVPMDDADRSMLIQGFVRQLIDPQFEHNKRESQLLHHLNTTVGGSALEYEEDQLLNKDEVKEHGASPGAHIIRKKNTPPIIRHNPPALSSGHLVMSDRHADSMKIVSGLNPDLLAMQDEGGQSSGRAIALRQKQGMVMVQKPFDHLGRTKWQLWRFMLSQLGEVYDVGRAMRVLGRAFLERHFSKPVLKEVPDGKGGKAVVQAMGPNGALFELDQKMASATIEEVLNGAELASYDVAVGDTAASVTTQLSNYFTVLEMVEKGVPIPPDVLVEESGLSPTSKKKIQAHIQAQQAQAAELARRGPGGGKK